MGRVSHEGSMAFCISGAKQYRQQRAAFLTGLCICRQHCAVNRINVGKIIRCLRLPQFAVRHSVFQKEIFLEILNITENHTFFSFSFRYINFYRLWCQAPAGMYPLLLSCKSYLPESLLPEIPRWKSVNRTRSSQTLPEQNT